MNNSNSLHTAIRDKGIDVDTANNVVRYIGKYCIDNSLDSDKVFREMEDIISLTTTITNLGSFVRGVLNKLDKSKFAYNKVHYVPKTQPFINDLTEKGFVVLADDTAWLYVVWEYIVNIKGITENDCVSLNHKIVAYMISKGMTDFASYKELLKKSKTLATYKIDWDLLEKKTIEYIDIWNKTLEELESVE